MRFGSQTALTQVSNMADSRDQDNTGLGVHQAARLEKLQKIEGRGLDPWGQRFDNRHFIRDVRSLADSVQFKILEHPRLDG